MHVSSIECYRYRSRYPPPPSLSLSPPTPSTYIDPHHIMCLGPHQPLLSTPWRCDATQRKAFAIRDGLRVRM